MISFGSRRPSARRLLLALLMVIVAAQGTTFAGQSSGTPALPKSAITEGAGDTERVIIFDGVTEAFLTRLGMVVDYKIVYRYTSIQGVAVAVPKGTGPRIVEFAQAQSLKAELDSIHEATLNSSTRTVYVKGAGQAWDLGYTGRGTTIAVLDSGMNGAHLGLNDLDDNAATPDPKILAFRNYVAGGAEVAPFDDQGHGSHTSGIAGGTGQGSAGTGPRGQGHVGVAYEANLVGLKVLDSGGSGAASNIVAAIDWMTNNATTVNPPIRVANYSIGPRVTTPGSNTGNSSQALAMNRAVAAGITFVQSGGNGDSNGLLPNQTAGNVGGDARDTIAVCSSNSAAPPTAPTYSAWDSEGPTGDGRPKPEVCAPGDGVMSVNYNTSSGYVSQGGTSMSAPHVAGIAALIIQAVPSITPAQVKEVIIKSALNYSGSSAYNPLTQNNGWDADRGWGEVRARQAIQLAISLYGGSPAPLSVVSGGPYSTIQNETRALSASGLNGQPPYTFAWDLDNNGSFETPGQSPTFTNTATPGDKSIQVRVTDSASATATTSTVVSVLAAVNVFTDNVEGATDNGWVSNNANGWHRSAVRSQSPTRSWYPGNDLLQQYQPLADFTLTKTINLSAGPGATSGQLLYRFSRSGDLETGFDFLKAQIKKTSDATWTTLATYDDELGATWSTASFDITSYKGFSTDFRFHFTSDNLFELTGPFIDDIKIIGTTPPAVDVVSPDPILNLAPGTATMASVPLTWTATGDDGATGTATSYDLRYGANPITAANFALATPVSGTPAPKTAGGAESFTVTGLTPNTSYFFAIKAIDEASNAGLISNIVAATTLADLIAPSKVLNLTGSAGNGLVNLSWSAATDNVGVAGYEILRDGIVTSTTTSTSAILTGLTNGTTYQFQVRAKDAANNIGLASDPLSLTPIAPPVVTGWPESRGGSARTGATGGRGSIAVPAIRQTLPLGSPVDASPLIVDLDGDADMDLVVVTDATATAPTVVRAYRQTPTGLVSMWTYSVPVLAGQNEGFGNIAVGQLNGGGPLEIAVYSNNRVNAQAATTNEGRLAVLNATTGALIDDLSVATTDAEALVIGVDGAPAIGDVDGDGNAEIILIHHVGGTTPGSFLASIGLSGSTLVEEFDTNLTTVSNWTSWALAELRPAHNGLEIVVGQNAAFINAASTGAVRVCKPAAGAAACDENLATTTGILGLSVADLDGDSQPEIVANGRAGNSLNVIKTSPSLSVVSRADGTLWNTASLADVDGDGKADIVNAAYSASGTGFPEWDPEMKGTVTVRGFTGSAIVAKGTLARGPTPGTDFGVRGGGALVDIAGTTRPEFVFGSANGTLNAVSLGATPASLWSIQLGSASGAPVAVGDVTGDGLLDLVAGTAGGNVVVVGAGPVASLTLTPATSTIAAGGNQVYAAEGFDSAGNSLGDVTPNVTLAITPNGNCSGATCTATSAGSHTVTASASGGATGTSTLEVTAGPLATLTLSPASASMLAGETRSFTANGADAYGNPLGDLTATTTFTLSPNGSCAAGGACTATIAGPHTVTGTNGSLTGTASLSVSAGPIADIRVTPAQATILFGGSQSYSASGVDAFGNPTGNVTSATTFTIAPDGSCTGTTCSAATVGDHTVTGINGAFSDSAVLHVLTATISRIDITPSTASVTAGTPQTYTVTAYDSANQSLGDITSQAIIGITTPGSCVGGSCSATIAGPYTVTATAGGLSDTASLTVTPGPATQLLLSPANATIAAGGSQVYTVSGADQYGNRTGDVTGSSTLTITPEGSCAGATCTGSTPGRHTVTATNGASTGSATLTVTLPAPVIISPNGGTYPASVLITGTASPASTIDVVEGSFPVAQNVAVAADGTWEVTSSFGTGLHTIRAVAKIAGTSSPASAPRSFTVDASPPGVDIRRPGGYFLTAVYTPLDDLTISGTAIDETRVDRVVVSVYDALTGDPADAATIICSGPCATTSWSFSPSLLPGLYTVEAVAFDSAGNRSFTDEISILTLSPFGSLTTGSASGSSTAATEPRMHRVLD